MSWAFLKTGFFEPWFVNVGYSVQLLCAEPERFVPPEIDSNDVERPDQISEPILRKMSLEDIGDSIIAKPGILAGT